MMLLYLCLLMVALTLCWRTVVVLSLVVVAENVTPHRKVAKR
jgi:hypothetical protein